MMLLKQFVRPHMGYQIVIIPVIGLLLYLFTQAQHHAWRRAVLFGVLGLFWASLFSLPNLQRVGTEIISAPSKAAASFSMLAMSKQDRDAITAYSLAESPAWKMKQRL